MYQSAIVRDSDVERLAHGVAKVLSEVGILCQNREILAALEESGARVDYPGERANFAPRMVEEFVQALRAGRPAPGTGATAGFVTPSLATVETQVAQFFHDFAAGERRSGNKADLIYLTKLGDVLHPDTPVGHSLLLTDVPPLLEPLEAALILAEYARRPGAAFAWKVDQIDYLLEMGDILGAPDWFEWGAICFAHPLRFDRDVADKLVRRARSGYPTGLTSMAVAGATAPVTLSGYVVVAGAEHVATWMAARALNPRVPLCGSMYGGAVNMKTGTVSYSSFDAMIYAFAVSEFLDKWCGVPVNVGGGEYCDARRPGFYAVLEKAYKAMTIAAFTGRHPPMGQGMLEEGKTLSPVQLLLERDFGLGLGHLARRISSDGDDLAMDVIMQVRNGLTSNYLESEHTARHFRQALWCPAIWERAGWTGQEEEDRALNRAQSRLNQLMASYRQPTVDPDTLARMRRVVERARRAFAAA